MTGREYDDTKITMIPLDIIAGYEVRPGFYEMNGATAIPCGVNFTVHSCKATSCELLLYKRHADEPFAVLPFPEHYKIGDVYSMIVFNIAIEDLEYAYRVDGPNDPKAGLVFDKEKILLDPYAKAVTGQSKWGKRMSKEQHYHARVVKTNYDWGNFKYKARPLQDLIIYELHVRGFTFDPSSGVKFPGTFEGLKEKIPYLKELGVNAVELMPIFEFDEIGSGRVVEDTQLYDYWGYNPVCFFAPNTAYTAKNEETKEGNTLKQLIKEFHENGIEVILDVVFNHTAEGNDDGEVFSFKGFDNQIYYLLTPEGEYYNFSGCGNTLNCNHPVVQQLILECLKYWVITYRIDGFRFDLASILGRNEDGSPMNKPPLLQSLAFDPILSDVKLIAEAWDAGGLYQVGSFPSWNRWAEWNGRYRDDLRSFLKGDGGFADNAVKRISGSLDIYNPEQRGYNVSVNFLTCHDGFTLYDLYSYNMKHNEENAWNNTDGADDNRSWNCGAEGDTDDENVLKLRYKMIRNAAAVLFCSRGTPMFFAGDEFGNTQFGNNNAYCQDNEISWLNWNLKEKNKDIFDFFKFMIAFRKKHEIIRKRLRASAYGFTDVSYHTDRANVCNYNYDTRMVGVMFAGRKADGKEDIVYIAVNAYWENVTVQLPKLPMGYFWKLAVDTGSNTYGFNLSQDVLGHWIMEPRSVVIMYAKSVM